MRDAGGGYDVGWTNAGQFLKYTVQVARAGTYRLSVRAASGDKGGTLHIKDVRGTDLTGPITVPNTGGYQTYADCPAKITLPAGTQTLTLFQDTGGYNLNSLTFTGP